MLPESFNTEHCNSNKGNKLTIVIMYALVELIVFNNTTSHYPEIQV